MNGEFRYAGRDGGELIIASSDEDGLNPDCIQVSGCADIPPQDFGRIIARMYEAAGKPVPVILERPAQWIEQAIIMPGAAYEIHGNNVRGTPTGDYGKPQDFSPQAIRDFAAALADLADRAESEPDQAEVRELAQEIRRCLIDRGVWGGTDPPKIAARVALRWMRDKQQRGGSE